MDRLKKKPDYGRMMTRSQTAQNHYLKPKYVETRVKRLKFLAFAEKLA